MQATRKSDQESAARSALAEAMLPVTPGRIFFDGLSRHNAIGKARSRRHDRNQEQLRNALFPAKAPSIDTDERLFETSAAYGFHVDPSKPNAIAEAHENIAKEHRKAHHDKQRRANGARNTAKSKTGDLHKDISDLAYRLAREFDLKPWPSLLRAVNELYRKQPERFLDIARGKGGSVAWINRIADQVRDKRKRRP
jgi:hypothetical protein